MNDPTPILPRAAFAPLRLPYEPPGVDVASLPAEPRADVLTKTPMLLLPGIALATLRYTAPPVADIVPTSWGMIAEASSRLALWRERGERMSAWRIAENFQALWWPLSWNNRRGGERHQLLHATPRRGMDVIRLTDEREVGGVHWWCDMPELDHRRGYRTMRLSDAILVVQSSTAGDHPGA